jgi:hypothetical protein
MIVWDIYDQYGNWLGTAIGFTEAEAISNAKSQNMDDALTAILCEE